jgi:hypothetical protein
MEFIPRIHQQKILDYTGGTLGISAVPGSGKTHILSALAAQIIGSGALGTDQEVLIVTLVNSAVDNFSARIAGFIRESGLIPHIGYRVRTLHGLAHDIVRENPSLVGLENRFAIVDEREADFIRKEAATAWLAAHPYELDELIDPGWTIPSATGCAARSCRTWSTAWRWPSSAPPRTTARRPRACAPVGPRHRASAAGGNGLGHLHQLPARAGLPRRSRFRRPDPPGAGSADRLARAARAPARALPLHPGRRSPGLERAAGADPGPPVDGELGAGGRPQPGHLRDLHHRQARIPAQLHRAGRLKQDLPVSGVRSHPSLQWPTI